MDNNGKRILSVKHFEDDKNVERILKEVNEKGKFSALVGPINEENINEAFSLVCQVREVGTKFSIDVNKEVIDGKAYLSVLYEKELDYTSPNSGFGGK